MLGSVDWRARDCLSVVTMGKEIMGSWALGEAKKGPWLTCRGLT